MATASIELATPDGPMPAYEAAPEGEARGGVVVVQEAFGVTAHIEDVCRRFAAAGWHALAPALFHRQGSPVFSYDDVASAMPVMRTLDRRGLSADLEAAFSHLEEAGLALRRIAVIGFCMGGTVALFAATQLPLGAAVSFYGGGITEGRFGLPSLIELAPSLQAPWLGCYGDRDRGIPVAEVEALREVAAAATASMPTEIVRYAEAQHGFHCDDRPAVFDPAAAADAWRRTLAWFDEHVAKS
ncbi:MAG TPA: dienelactone hydrolase family protein [Acidimicrobiales bacterium]|nr:dienelactone hydrolase family protein [Acidimicrobiales bacterium]